MAEPGKYEQRRGSLITGAVLLGLLLAIFFSIFHVIIKQYLNYAEVFVLGILLVFFFRLIVQVYKKNDQNYLPKKGINYILIVTSVLVCFLGLELYLRYGYQETSGGPKLVLHKYKELNEKINRENKIIAKENPHGFTDKVRREQKEPGVYRVAVLGDSFIWGDGVPCDQVWTHKLERRLVAAYPGQVEVLSWGRRGWSTLDEYNFLK